MFPTSSPAHLFARRGKRKRGENCFGDEVAHVSITYQNYVLAMHNNYYVIKNYVLHKLATFNAGLLRYCIYCEPTSYLKLRPGKHSNLPKKTCRQKKNLTARPETARLSVNDINSKRYKQPGEVEHSSCISSRNSPEKAKYGQTWRLCSERKTCAWKRLSL